MFCDTVRRSCFLRLTDGSFWFLQFSLSWFLWRKRESSLLCLVTLGLPSFWHGFYNVVSYTCARIVPVFTGGPKALAPSINSRKVLSGAFFRIVFLHELTLVDRSSRIIRFAFSNEWNTSGSSRAHRYGPHFGFKIVSTIWCTTSLTLRWIFMTPLTNFWNHDSVCG